MLAAVLVGATAACSSGHVDQAPNGAPTTSAATTGSSTSPTLIPWAALRNPLLREPSHAVKDPAIVFAKGRWRALFSYVDDRGTWRIGVASSADLRRWSRI